MPDPLLPRAFQPLDEHYQASPYDRGHLVRPLAVSWGEERLAAIARRHSFFFTNSAPRHLDMNRPWARALADWEARVVAERGRAIGFSGPILREDDPFFRDVSQTLGRLVAHQTFRLPRAFWKVVVAPGSDEKLSLAAFLLDQRALPGSRARSPSAARAYDPENHLATLETIETETGIEFSEVLHEAEARPLRR